jgi:hypothetical protein
MITRKEIKIIKRFLEKNPSMSVSEIVNTLTSYMDKSATTVEKLGSNDNETIKRALKRAFGYERKIKQSKGKKASKHGS